MGWIAVIVVMLNVAISIWNSYVTGKSWAEAKFAGGWPQFMAWMGAIMAASGMSWSILIILMYVAVGMGFLPAEWGVTGLRLGCLILIPGVLVSGLMITVHSWATAFRTRKVLDYGVSGYNSFTEMYDTYHAVRGLGPSTGKVVDAFFGGKSKDGKGAAIVLVIFLVVLAIAAGSLITAGIIHHVAASSPLPSYDEAIQKLRGTGDGVEAMTRGRMA